MQFRVSVLAVAVFLLMCVFAFLLVVDDADGKVLEEDTVVMNDHFRREVEVTEGHTLYYSYFVHDYDPSVHQITFEVYYHKEENANQFDWEYVDYGNGELTVGDHDIDGHYGYYVFMWDNSAYSIGGNSTTMDFVIGVEESSVTGCLCWGYMGLALIGIIMVSIILMKTISKRY
jgi:hypothetical protein